MASILTIRVPPTTTSATASSSSTLDSAIDASTLEPTRKPRTFKRQQIVRPTPKNPQATLLGLPTELRLKIYQYGFHSTLIHIHHYEAQLGADGTEVSPPRFTWTPCQGSNPKCLLLCENSRWSGLCKNKDRCAAESSSPPEPKGFFALMWTCKFIHQEARESIYRNSVISINPKDLLPWLDYVSWNQLHNLRRINLACRDQDLSILKKLREHAPNLEGVAFQGPASLMRSWYGGRIDRENPWRNWRNLSCAEALYELPSNMTVVIEWLAWRKRRSDGPKEEQYRYRIIREGKTGNDPPSEDNGWEDERLEIDILSSYPTEWKKDSPWKKTWRSKEYVGWTY